MNSLIEQYINSKRLAWAPTTLKTELSRLNAHIVRIDDSADKVYQDLADGGMKPYAIKTTFIRLGEFYAWLLDAGKRVGENKFKVFLKANARLFKFAYVTEKLDIDYEEAVRRISWIKDASMQLAARQLLEGGLRSCELDTINNGRVIGKGGKPREIFLDDKLAEFKFSGTYAQLYYALKKVGLKPHSLRKLCATKLGSQPDMNVFDVLESFGWASAETGKRYMQPKRGEQLAKGFKKVRG